MRRPPPCISRRLRRQGRGARLSQQQDRDGGNHAHQTGNLQSGHIGIEVALEETGAKGGGGCPQLMTGKDPAENKTGLFTAEVFRGKLHRRRHGRYPVQPVEDGKDRKLHEAEA